MHGEMNVLEVSPVLLKTALPQSVLGARVAVSLIYRGISL